jgi:hypothetical protein
MKKEEIISSSNSSNKQDKNLLDETCVDDYQPVQKNTKLLKLILYASKVEIKSNSFIKMVFSISLLELGLWMVSLLLFIASPKTLYLIWVLFLHVGKAVLGLILITNMPKTYEIMDELYKREDIEEERFVEILESLTNQIFMERWKENRIKLFIYFILNILCMVSDSAIFALQLILYGNLNYFLMQITLMFIIIVFFISDVIYFLWFVTIRFTFPEFMVNPIINAIIGLLKDLRSIITRYILRKGDN